MQLVCTFYNVSLVVTDIEITQDLRIRLVCKMSVQSFTDMEITQDPRIRLECTFYNVRLVVTDIEITQDLRIRLVCTMSVQSFTDTDNIGYQYTVSLYNVSLVFYGIGDVLGFQDMVSLYNVSLVVYDMEISQDLRIQLVCKMSVQSIGWENREFLGSLDTFSVSGIQLFSQGVAKIVQGGILFDFQTK